jgi:hypothetical protein
MYTPLRNYTSPLSILCTLIPQLIPPLTLTLVWTWYKESTPWGLEAHKVCEPTLDRYLYFLIITHVSITKIPLFLVFIMLILHQRGMDV